MQLLSVVNTGALNFVKLQIEDMDQVSIQKDVGLLGIRNGRSDIVSVIGRIFYLVYNCHQLYIFFQMPFMSFVL